MVELSVIIFEPRPDGTLPPGQAPRPFTLSVSTEDGTAGIYMHLFIARAYSCENSHVCDVTPCIIPLLSRVSR